MTDYPGEQFPPAVDPDVEPGADPRTDEEREPDYDSEPGSSAATWVNPTQQARPHTDPLLAGFTMYGETPAEPDPEPEPVSSYEADAAEPISSYDAEPADDFVDAEDTEQTFEASLEEEPASSGLDDPAASYEELPEAADEPAASYEELPEVQVEEPVRAVPSPAAFARPAPPVGASSGFPTPAPPAEAPSAFPRPAPPAAPAPADEAEYDGEDAPHPLVEETMGRLDELRERPVGEHAEVYADLHERLQSALVEADAEHGDRG